jgi:glycosyltransferase involved in cell wall biosynthesis
MKNTLISLVVPVYNEELSINFFYSELKKYLHHENYEIVFVDDGSKDDTSEKIKCLIEKDNRVKLVCFIRNFGKENALFAGLKKTLGDVVIPIDVDLQDPLPVVLEMLDLYRKNGRSVLAQRIDRGSDSFLKRNSSRLFYKVFNLISDIKIPYDVGDFRLLTREVVNRILELNERNLFMKGVFSWATDDVDIVEYKREQRISGVTKFNFFSLFSLAISGVVDFSTSLLRFWVVSGFMIAFASLFFAFYIIIRWVFYGVDVPGYTSIIVSILFIGGVQLMGLGLLGEYIGRIYMEVKSRPRYIEK